MRKDLGALEEAMRGHTRAFEAEREHRYNLLNNLEGDMVNLQNQKDEALQLVQAREQ